MNFVVFVEKPSDRPRRGRPPKVTGKRREWILQVARQRFDTPSTKHLAAELGVPEKTVQRVICEELRRLRGGRQ